jgi:hypothetical protein
MSNPRAFANGPLATMIRDIMRAVLLALLLTFGATANAHEQHVTFATLVVDDRTVSLEMRIAATDLEEVTGRALTISGGIANPHRLAEFGGEIIGYIRPKLMVAARALIPCPSSGWSLAEDFQSVVVRARYDCTRVDGDLSFTNNLLFEVASATRHFTRVGSDPKVQPRALTVREPTLQLTGPPPPLSDVLARYTLSGIEHIFIGIDHIAFLIALLLWARSFVALVKIVTGFTLAHSVTLSLAALDVVTLPSALIEPAIALTIVYVAAENFFRHGIAGKWRGAFLLGLVHGFGFASVLQDVGFPQGALGWALAAFNVGVEVGQIVIVALVFPLLLLLDRLVTQRERVVYAGSAVIMGLGVFWLVERLMGA